MKKRMMKIASYLLIAGIVTTHMGKTMSFSTVHATTVSGIQNQINEHRNTLQTIYEQIASMEVDYDILQEEIDDLNAEILNTMTEIGLKEDEITAKEGEIAVKEGEIAIKEGEIAVKEGQIAETEEKYKAAKEQEELQRESMAISTRLMYENGTVSYLQVLLQGVGLAELLNRLDFVERIYSYEKNRLVKYIAAQEAAQILGEQLMLEKAGLVTDKNSLEAAEKILLEDKKLLEEDRLALDVQKANLDGLLEHKRAQSEDFEEEIAKAQIKANDTKKQIQAEEKKLQTLQAQLTAQQAVQNAVNGTYVSSYNAVIDAANGSELGKQMARFACQYIGNQYVYGGNSLTDGIDCSGFTQKVYAQFGYSLSRTSFSQCSEGREVSYDEIQPGDIICYPGHVGLYIGGGLIVHASNSKPYPQGGIKVSNALYRDYTNIRRIVE